MRARVAGIVGIVLAAVAAAGLLWLRPPDPAPKKGDQLLLDVSDPGPAERPPPVPGAPNVVLVIGCTVRRDQTSVYGGPESTTPFLASIAREGVVLDDLVAAAPWTRAASTAILSGYHPVAIGMADAGGGRDDLALPDGVVTLAEHLRTHGYRTAGMTTNPNLNDVYGFHQGFDRYRELAHLWRERGVKMPGVNAVRKALELLEGLPDDRPFYLQLVLVDAHAPFTATAEEVARQAADGVPDEVVEYRAVLRRLDDAVARLDAELRARGHGPDDTLLVVVNDHGEGLGWPEHHGQSHGRFLAPSSVGGVFVARGPGIPAGAVVRGVASQVDVASTIVGLAGLPPFPGSGVDLSAAIRAGGETGRDHAFTDTWFKAANRAAVYTSSVACQLDFAPGVREDKGRGFVPGCFDRRNDPSHESPFRDEGLEAALRAWRAERLAEARAAGEAPRAIAPEGVEQQLRALGYTE